MTTTEMNNLCSQCANRLPSGLDFHCVGCREYGMRHFRSKEFPQIYATPATLKPEPKSDQGTGATRSDRTGKGRYDLIPPCAIRRLAVRFEEGGRHHGDENWKKGTPTSRCMDAAMRHLGQYWAGARDEDHLGAAMWNIAAMMWNEEHNKDMAGK